MAAATMDADRTRPQGQWNQTRYEESVLREVELPWQRSTETFSAEPEADAIATSRAMHTKYGFNRGP